MSLLFMSLILILGPMKSGKSFDLINYFLPIKEAGIKHALFQHKANIRNEHIQSRAGLHIEAKKVTDLSEILNGEFDVVGIDEIHFFDEDQAYIIAELLKKVTKVVISGLNLDYRGEIFPIVKKLMKMSPEKVLIKKSICDICGSADAEYTQISDKNGPIMDGLPESVPEDGTYIYKAVCRNCFVRPDGLSGII